MLRPHTRRALPAFTLIELLVVIAVIGVLAALLLPAVQKVREAANRMSCQNNLKNHGLAVHHFENTRGRLPPGGVTDPFPEAGVLVGTHGLWTFLLPYLEQEGLARRYRWDVRSFDPANQPTVATPLKVLQCPSAPPGRIASRLESPDWGGGQGGTSDYATTRQVNPVLADMGLIDPAGNYDGALQRNAWTPLAAITDGTSTTTMVGESAGRPQAWRHGRLDADNYFTGGSWCRADNTIFVDGALPDGTARPGPCAVNCINYAEFYSFHPGGANALFVDGSVHFLREGMTIRVLAALVTRAGGEVLSGTDF